MHGQTSHVDMMTYGVLAQNAQRSQREYAGSLNHQRAAASGNFTPRGCNQNANTVAPQPPSSEIDSTVPGSLPTGTSGNNFPDGLIGIDQRSLRAEKASSLIYQTVPRNLPASQQLNPSSYISSHTLSQGVPGRQNRFGESPHVIQTQSYTFTRSNNDALNGTVLPNHGVANTRTVCPLTPLPNLVHRDNLLPVLMNAPLNASQGVRHDVLLPVGNEATTNFVQKSTLPVLNVGINPCGSHLTDSVPAGESKPVISPRMRTSYAICGNKRNRAAVPAETFVSVTPKRMKARSTAVPSSSTKDHNIPKASSSGRRPGRDMQMNASHGNCFERNDTFQALAINQSNPRHGQLSVQAFSSVGKKIPLVPCSDITEEVPHNPLNLYWITFDDLKKVFIPGFSFLAPMLLGICSGPHLPQKTREYFMTNIERCQDLLNPNRASVAVPIRIISLLKIRKFLYLTVNKFSVELAELIATTTILDIATKEVLSFLVLHCIHEGEPWLALIKSKGYSEATIFQRQGSSLSTQIDTQPINQCSNWQPVHNSQASVSVPHLQVPGCTGAIEQLPNPSWCTDRENGMLLPTSRPATAKSNVTLPASQVYVEMNNQEAKTSQEKSTKASQRKKGKRAKTGGIATKNARVSRKLKARTRQENNSNATMGPTESITKHQSPALSQTPIRARTGQNTGASNIPTGSSEPDASIHMDNHELSAVNIDGEQPSSMMLGPDEGMSSHPSQCAPNSQRGTSKRSLGKASSKISHSTGNIRNEDTDVLLRRCVHPKNYAPAITANDQNQSVAEAVGIGKGNWEQGPCNTGSVLPGDIPTGGIQDSLQPIEMISSSTKATVVLETVAARKRKSLMNENDKCSSSLLEKINEERRETDASLLATGSNTNNAELESANICPAAADVKINPLAHTEQRLLEWAKEVDDVSYELSLHNGIFSVERDRTVRVTDTLKILLGNNDSLEEQKRENEESKQCGTSANDEVAAEKNRIFEKSVNVLDGFDDADARLASMRNMVLKSDCKRSLRCAVEDDCKSVMKSNPKIFANIKEEFRKPVVYCLLRIPEVRLPKLVVRTHGAYPGTGTTYAFERPSLGWIGVVADIKSLFERNLSSIATSKRGVAAVLEAWAQAADAIINGPPLSED